MSWRGASGGRTGKNNRKGRI
jgi:hypothetical protein